MLLEYALLFWFSPVSADIGDSEGHSTGNMIRSAPTWCSTKAGGCYIPLLLGSSVPKGTGLLSDIVPESLCLILFWVSLTSLYMDNERSVHLVQAARGYLKNEGLSMPESEVPS